MNFRSADATTFARRWSHVMSWTALATIVLAIVAQWDVSSLIDDAYMYARYADHFLKYGVVSWNPNGPPAFGATSLLHLGLVIVLRWVGAGTPSIVLLGLSTAIGVLFLIAHLVLVTVASPADAERRRIIRLLALLALLPKVASFGSHFTSGMDTATSMLVLALYLLALVRYETARSTVALATAALIGPLIMLVRPDLLVFSLGIPAAWWLWPAQPGDRARATNALAYMAVLTLVTLWAQHRWLGSVLPLPFWAKTAGVYGQSYSQLYHLVSAQTLVEFLLKSGTPLLAITTVILAGPKLFWQRASPTVRGALVGTVVLMAFYSTSVLPIMDFDARFYHPLLAAFALIAVRAGTLAFDELHLEQWQVPRATIRKFSTAGGFLVSAVVVTFSVQQAVALAKFSTSGEVFRTRPEALFLKSLPCWQRPLDLPTAIVFGTTEAGLLASNPERVVYDLAGINSAEFLASPLDARLIMAKRPDFLVSLHGDYKLQLDRLRADPDFQRDYVQVGDMPSSGIDAIRKDSPYFDLLLKTGPCR